MGKIGSSCAVVSFGTVETSGPGITVLGGLSQNLTAVTEAC